MSGQLIKCQEVGCDWIAPIRTKQKRMNGHILSLHGMPDQVICTGVYLLNAIISKAVQEMKFNHIKQNNLINIQAKSTRAPRYLSVSKK